jgi:hypothetical protein
MESNGIVNYYNVNTIKGTMGVKVKVLFQGLHISHIILVYNFEICNLDVQYNIACYI